MSVSKSQMQISDLDALGGPRKPAAHQVTIRIGPPRGWLSVDLKEVWDYRELLYFLVWRDVKVRYKQTVIGAAWAVVQPLLMMFVFMIVFRTIANVSSDGLPYSVFAYTALLPWNLFANALGRSSISIVQQSNLTSKVYFPRLIIPLSATFSGIVDFVIGFVILLGMMAWFGLGVHLRMLAVPAFVLLAMIAALSVGLWLSALNVQYRDVTYIVPFIVQLWMFASPIAYPVSLVPAKWRTLYSLNPVVGVVEGLRWALLGKHSPDFTAVAVSTIAMIALLIGGIIYFNRMEQTFADVI